MSIIKLYQSSVAASGIFSASADVPLDGHITTVGLGVSILGDAAFTDAQAVTGEVSFSSSPQFTSNDVRNSLCMAQAVQIGGGAAASWLGIPSVPFCVLTGLRVRIYAGEKIWLHVQSTVGITNFAGNAYVYIEDSEDRGRVRARSRRG